MGSSVLAARVLVGRAVRRRSDGASRLGKLEYGIRCEGTGGSAGFGQMF